MECAEIRELLSEYLDHTLDSETKVLVQEHVQACSGCKEELNLLRSLVGALGSLEPVKAPDDFLERLRKRIEKRLPFSKLWQKLFVPLPIKIPMQFAAVTAVALLVFSVVRTQQPHKRVARTVKESAPMELAKGIPSEVGESTPKATVSTERASNRELEDMKREKKIKASRQVRSARRIRENSVQPSPKGMAPIESHSKDVLGSIAESQVEITGKEPMIAVKGKVEYEPDQLKADSEAAAQYGPEGKAIDLVFEIEKGEIQALTVPNSAMKLKLSLVGTPKPSTERYASYIEKSAKKAAPLQSSREQHLKAAFSDAEGERLVMSLKDDLLHEGEQVISIDYEKFMKGPPSVTAEVSPQYYESLIRKFREAGSLKGSPPSISDKDTRGLRVRFWFVSSK